MIVILKTHVSEIEIARISLELSRQWGVNVDTIRGHRQVLLGMIGDTAGLDPRRIQNSSPWIEQVMRISQPFKRVSLEFRNGEASA
ncbi:MAG: 3-deoxy-7-phosphoheptulonate synthase, partial [Phormidesmis sp.]